MLVFKKNCASNKWDVIGLLLMIEIFNDVVVVLIGIFGKSPNYRGETLPKILYLFFYLLVY